MGYQYKQMVCHCLSWFVIILRLKTGVVVVIVVVVVFSRHDILQFSNRTKLYVHVILHPPVWKPDRHNGTFRINITLETSSSWIFASVSPAAPRSEVPRGSSCWRRSFWTQWRADCPCSTLATWQVLIQVVAVPPQLAMRSSATSRIIAIFQVERGTCRLARDGWGASSNGFSSK